MLTTIASKVDGVHIGQEDMDLAEVKADFIGPDKILGLSVETEATALNLDPAIIDYAGAGPVFATLRQSETIKITNRIHWLEAFMFMLNCTSCCDWGVKGRTLHGTLSSGADGVAVVSAICGQPDPEQSARNLFASLKRAEREL